MKTGALIPGATSNEYIPSQSGLYFAIVSDGICQDASRCIPVTILSSTDNVSGRPSIFPNLIARDGVLQIRNLSSGKVSFSIRDYKGQMLQAWSVPVEEKQKYPLQVLLPVCIFFKYKQAIKPFVTVYCIMIALKEYNRKCRFFNYPIRNQNEPPCLSTVSRFYGSI